MHCAWTYVVVLSLLFTPSAPLSFAQYLPPVDPPEPNSDHHHEDHSGHRHIGQDFTTLAEST